jgi:hypothetical protein
MNLCKFKSLSSTYSLPPSASRTSGLVNFFIVYFKRQSFILVRISSQNAKIK